VLLFDRKVPKIGGGGNARSPRLGTGS